MDDKWPMEPVRLVDVPYLSYPDEGTHEQGVLVYIKDMGDNKLHACITVYEPFENNPDLEHDEVEHMRRKAYNLKPYFDLSNMELYAYPMTVPGYKGHELVTLMLQPTKYYTKRWPVHYNGTNKDVPQHEYRLFQNKRMQNGRTFLSLENGLNDLKYTKDGPFNATTDEVRQIAQTKGTFWIFLWNSLTGDKFNMKLVPNFKRDAQDSRPTATGRFYIENGQHVQEHIMLNHLDNTDDPPMPVGHNHQLLDMWACSTNVGN